MPQPPANYPGMTTVQCPELLEYLTNRYGRENVRWPVIFYQAGNMQPLWLTFEVNQRNTTNAGMTGRFFEQGALPEYFIDYTSSPRQVIPLTSQPWPDPPGSAIIAPRHSSSYNYIESRDNRSLNTIDIDYVWKQANGQHFMLELSTFWVRMVNVEKAVWLVQQAIKKRFAAAQAHHLRILARVARLQGITLSLVFVNVVDKGSNEIFTAGNVFVIPLSEEIADSIHRGEFPARYQFLPWSTWMASL